jgi:steroid 5-alpha reductase family enzyme
MNAGILWLCGLPAALALAIPVWAICTLRRNAGLVDIFWSLFFVACAIVYAMLVPAASLRLGLSLALLIAWALRLAGHLAIRNWNAPEDHRYREIRARNEPGFAFKSLYLVFGLQGVLAWLVSAPLAAAFVSAAPLGAPGILGALLASFGIAFEAIADAQLASFKKNPANRKAVMDRGLWRYSRHPNYFGEFCAWWGLYLLALDGGGWWTVFSPLVMTLLLLRVSGVTLLERDIGERRPEYGEYVKRTNAFFPGPRREA